MSSSGYREHEEATMDIQQMHPGNGDTKFLTVPTAGIKLAYETFGRAGQTPVLFMEGVGADMTIFPIEELINPLVALGCYVIRYDHRDNGQSHYYTGDTVSVVKVGLKQIAQSWTGGLMGSHNPVPYKLPDMAKDGVELMDVLGIKQAHIIGHSMGGMIAQQVAILNPERVLSLTLINTCVGPGAGPVKASLLKLNSINNKEFAQFKPDKASFDDIVESKLQYYKAQSGNLWTQEWHEKATAERVRRMTRGYAAYLKASDRHCAAVAVAEDRSVGLGELRSNGMTGPVLVLHGELDPILPAGNAEVTQSCISGSHLEVIEGMGHVIIPETCEQMVAAFRRYVFDASAGVS